MVIQLSEEAGQVLLKQLYEDERLRKKVADYEAWIEREKDLYARERAVHQDELTLEKSKTALCGERVAFYKEQIDTYKALYNTVTKKRGGVGCFFRAFFTIGISRCP